MATKTLYVGNLPYGITEDEVKALFAEWEPGEVRLVADKGFAFVDLPDEKTADAIRILAEYDYRLAMGANPEVQLTALLAELAALRSGGGGKK